MTWQESFKTALKSVKELKAFYSDSNEHLESLPTDFDEKKYPLFIPIELANKIKQLPVNSVLWKQFIPRAEESLEQGLEDPIGDQIHQKTKQLIHRYPSRALFLPITICPVHCRYCFRKNELYGEEKAFSHDFEKTLDYLKEHPEIDEIIFTGGDPLLLSDSKIEYYLESFSKIEHIKFIRFHSRTPVIIPERLTESLNELLLRFSKKVQIILAIHINHLDEWSPTLEKKLQGMNKETKLLSQTVLLKEVNDNPGTLIALFKKLSQNRVTPYYLHHPDQALGTQHFWLSLEQGRKIYQQLRAQLSGWMIPEYIIDIPGGHGKSPAFNPESVISSGKLFDTNGVLRNISLLDKAEQTQ